MNREIKFRLWTCDGMKFRTLFDENKYIPTSENVMQYTGVKDKNGKEIYEGDIINHYGFKSEFIVKFGIYKRKDFSNHDRQVEHHGWYGDPISNFDKKTQIEWNGEIESLVNFRNGIEVIGNIYENPELFE